MEAGEGGGGLNKFTSANPYPYLHYPLCVHTRALSLWLLSSAANHIAFCCFVCVFCTVWGGKSEGWFVKYIYKSPPSLPHSNSGDCGGVSVCLQQIGIAFYPSLVSISLSSLLLSSTTLLPVSWRRRKTTNKGYTITAKPAQQFYSWLFQNSISASFSLLFFCSLFHEVLFCVVISWHSLLAELLLFLGIFIFILFLLTSSCSSYLFLLFCGVYNKYWDTQEGHLTEQKPPKTPDMSYMTLKVSTSKITN